VAADVAASLGSMSCEQRHCRMLCTTLDWMWNGCKWQIYSAVSRCAVCGERDAWGGRGDISWGRVIRGEGGEI